MTSRQDPPGNQRLLPGFSPQEKGNYRGLILDCVGVCLEDGQENALPDLQARLGNLRSTTVTSDEIRQALKEARPDYTTGRSSVEEYWSKVLGNLTIPLIAARQKIAGEKGLKVEDVNEKIVAETLEGVILSKYKPIEQTISLIGRLSQAGYVLGMISNTSQTRAGYWLTNFEPAFRPFGPRTHFSFVFPYQRKPEVLSQAIREMDERYMKIGLLHIIYIDDLEKNVNETAKIGVGGIVRLVDKAEPAGQQDSPAGIVSATRDTLEPTLRNTFGLVF